MPKIVTHQFGKTHCEICPMQDPLKYYENIGAYCRQFREYLYKDGPKILRGPTCLKDEIAVRDFLMPELKGRYYDPPAEDTSCGNT